MLTVLKYLKTGWHALESIHTAVWVLSLVGISSSSVIQSAQQVADPKYLPWLLLGQVVVWVSIVAGAVAYVGYRASPKDREKTEAVLKSGAGGAGGGGTIYGNRGTVIGGHGGDGGVSGVGGAGGSGFAQGDDALIVGGDGGSAGTPDGRGGRGARSPMERMGGPTQMWPFGRGGAGANDVEYGRRISLLAKFRQEYVDAFPQDAQFVHAGIDPVPVHWINKRLEEVGESWRVWQGAEGYILPPL